MNQINTKSEKVVIAIVFVIFLLLVVVVVLVVSHKDISKGAFINQSAMVVPTPFLASQSTLLLYPSNANDNSFYIQIESGQNEVLYARLDIQFDPKVLTQVDIFPGNFLKSPVVYGKQVNQAAGSASILIGVPPGEPGNKGKGIFAVMTAKPVAAFPLDTTIAFLPSTTVTAKGIKTSVLTHAIGTTLKIAPTPVFLKPSSL